MAINQELKTEPRNYKIAFITTPLYRENRTVDLIEFICSHMFSICKNFDVISTGQTRAFIADLVSSGSYSDFQNNIMVNPKFLQKVNLTPKDETRVRLLIKRIMADTHQPSADLAYEEWSQTIRNSITEGEKIDAGLLGMVDIICEVIGERLNAVIHLTDWQDKASKMDSAVLSREANVHNVPIATNIETASNLLKLWCRDITSGRDPFENSERAPKAIDVADPLNGITTNDRVLAIISHDGKKLEMSKFVVKHARDILKYHFILATGTTGSYIKKFLEAKGFGEQAKNQVRCCNSGPEGGDLQIAYAVVHGKCQDIIFFQDPKVSHPHDADIRLLEQAVLTSGVHARIATNQATAAMLIRR
ncbi:MAG: methylglyoxal synthase [Thermoproteota archaeon]|nr:methylglyoxal synthase [Thermoproteota archaeon]NLD66314.1 methylglyoxal synthase [Thermoproteota archaeon]